MLHGETPHMLSQILIASNNRGKLLELRALLTGHGMNAVSPIEAGIALDIEESGTTFAANAVLKAEGFARVRHGIVLADDSGLVVDALGGGPGVYSARYGGPGATDDDRNRLLLRQMEGVTGAARSARFIATVAVVAPGHATAVFEGAVDGMIATEARGFEGFGYDPVFYFPAFGRTFGEVGPAAKARVSHRAKALHAAIDYLQTLVSTGILETN